jgi:hypothetical protein
MKTGAPAFKGAACEPRLMEWINYIGGGAYMIINSTDKDFDAAVFDALMTNMPIIVLGKAAAKAIANWGLKESAYFVLPHPSGRNRQLNDKLWVYFKLLEAKEWVAAQSSP